MYHYRYRRWAHGQRPRDVAPHIYSISRKKNRCLREPLYNRNWIKGINIRHRDFSAQHFRVCVLLWKIVQHVELRLGAVDDIKWKLSADRIYSAKSAYNAQFIGSTYTNFDALIWKVWAPRSCKIFSWLAIQNRLWTADRLRKRGWPNQLNCPLCRNIQESAMHLSMQGDA